jgi:hypothetical protein
MRKTQKEVHEVHWTFAFRGLGGELVTFPHVHEVHDVHEVHQKGVSHQLSAKPILELSKILSIAG